ncbi:MAG: hypothetical protein H7A36_05205 [Chlamydiales bacterium]|nr:hypothetical protein [Chlamydiales bacterium]
MKKRLLSITFVFTFAFAGSYFGLQLALWGLCDTFRIKSIQSTLTPSCKWETRAVDYPKEIFTQPYHYLTHGSQSYIFESEDGRYVIKFFRHNRFRTTHMAGLPSFLQQIHEERRLEKEVKREELFASCLLAYNELKEECGLLYMHLNKTTHLKKTLLIYDSLRNPYALNLDEFEFFVQKRGEPLIVRLSRKEEAASALQQISALLIKRFKKGIDDHDPVLQKNTGFCGETPLFLDIGSFYRNDYLKNGDHSQIIHNMTRKLKRYTLDPQIINLL